jgi:hypothetical protein
LILADNTGEFRAVLDAADVIIAKGQGNFGTPTGQPVLYPEGQVWGGGELPGRAGGRDSAAVAGGAAGVRRGVMLCCRVPLKNSVMQVTSHAQPT